MVVAQTVPSVPGTPEPASHCVAHWAAAFSDNALVTNEKSRTARAAEEGEGEGREIMEHPPGWQLPVNVAMVSRVRGMCVEEVASDAPRRRLQGIGRSPADGPGTWRVLVRASVPREGTGPAPNSRPVPLFRPPPSTNGDTAFGHVMHGSDQW